MSNRKHTKSLCPCDSGKEYAKCCGRKSKAKKDTGKPDKIALMIFKDAMQAFKDQRHLHCASALKECLKRKPYHLGAINLLFSLPNRFGIYSTEEMLKIAGQALQADPNNLEILHTAGLIFENNGDSNQAVEVYNKIQAEDSNHFLSHFGLGRIAQRRHQLDIAEYHYRQALFRNPQAFQIETSLAVVLSEQGRKHESEHHFKVALSLAPKDFSALTNWSRMEESRGNLDKAWKLFGMVKEFHQHSAELLITEATLLHRSKKYKQAIVVLDSINISDLHISDRAIYWFERHQILNNMGLYDQAYHCAISANSQKLALGVQYDDKQHLNKIKELKTFFVRKKVGKLRPAKPISPLDEDPIFICGFTRSGTSMVEQILSAHSNICGGDELPYIFDIANMAKEILNSNRNYPHCLVGKNINPQLSNIQLLKQQYLLRLRQTGILEPGVRRFTDKMPMNEMHLGLINLMFPKSKVVHVMRHPLDSVLSSFFIDASHGGYCLYDLVHAAKHYRSLYEMTQHYLRNLKINYHLIRYEDVVKNIKPEVRKLLKFLGEPFEESCVQFHKNPRYSRTASYSQVTEKLYTSSIYRYKNYQSYIDEVVPILSPVIKKLGYEI